MSETLILKHPNCGVEYGCVGKHCLECAREEEMGHFNGCSRFIGRPTEYKQEYIAKVDEYLALCEDEIIEFHKTRGDKSDSYERLVNVKLPKIEGFAEFIDVSKKVLYDWENAYPDFLHALDKIRKAQHNRLIDNGLSGAYNPLIAKLVLSSNHGYKEKSEAENKYSVELKTITGIEVHETKV